MFIFKRNPFGTGGAIPGIPKRLELSIIVIQQAKLKVCYGYRQCFANQYQLGKEQQEAFRELWIKRLRQFHCPTSLNHEAWLIELQGVEWILSYHDRQWRLTQPECAEFPYNKQGREIKEVE